MNRKIDKLGRVSLPVNMRKALDLQVEDEVSIELIDNAIIITNIKKFDVKMYILQKLNELKSYEVGNNEILDLEYTIKKRIYNDLISKMN